MLFIDRNLIRLSVYKTRCFSSFTASFEMENSFQKTMLLQSVCCLVLGFFPPEMRESKFKNAMSGYCGLVTVLFATCWTVFTAIKLTRMQYNFVGVLFLAEDMVRITMITYYRVKHAVGENLISEVYKNIDYADKCLERVGIQVSHTRELRECTVHLVGNTLMFVLFVFIATTRVEVMYEIISEMYCVLNVLVKFAIIYSILVSLSQFTYLLYVMKKRLSLLCDAIQKSDSRLERRRAAWCDNLALTVVEIPRRKRSLNETLSYWNEIRNIETCLRDAYLLIKNFYNAFKVFVVLIYLLGTSFVLLQCTLQRDSLHFVFILISFTLLQATPVVLCEYIAGEFQTIQDLMDDVYWSGKFNIFKSNVRWHKKHKRLFRCIFRQQKFDCGFFEIDKELLIVLWDFLLLFLFSMIPLYI